jgi:hypothetical protein
MTTMFLRAGRPDSVRTEAPFMQPQRHTLRRRFIILKIEMEK